MMFETEVKVWRIYTGKECPNCLREKELTFFHETYVYHICCECGFRWMTDLKGKRIGW